MHVLSACMTVDCMCPGMPEEGLGFPRSGVILEPVSFGRAASTFILTVEPSP